MREILFRGKRSNQWVLGSLIQAENFCCILGEDDGSDMGYPYLDGDLGVIDGQASPVDPETVGQYTGLVDKNGRKIFEGDIVLFEDESSSIVECCTEMRFGVVEYGDNCFYITNRIAVAMEELIYGNLLDVEIIGNIHDNPELLGGD